MSPRFYQLAIDVPAERADELAYLLMELGAQGVDLQDDTTMTKGPGGGLVRLVVSVVDAPDGERLQRAWAAEEPELPAALVVLEGDAWRDAYKEHFKPFALSRRVAVRPPWVEEIPPEVAREVVLCLDPGRAFGTGLHATTSLCAELLDELADRHAGRTVLDAGTGSGILALVAASLGAKRVDAYDIDADAVEVARENVVRNGREEAIQLGTDPPAPGARYAVVVANIRASVLVELAATLAAWLEPNGMLLLSGVLASEADEVRSCFVAAGLSSLGERARGDGEDAWVALIFEANDSRSGG